MKRFAILLAASALAAPAFAADIIAEEPPAPAPAESAPTYNWTGLYIGGQAGAAFGGSSGAVGADASPSSLDGFSTFTDSADVGFTGGVHVGYDYQFANGLLLGGVADFNYIDRDRSFGVTLNGVDTNADAAFSDNAGYRNDVDINYFGTVRGKVGYAMDRVAIYATGGFAYADVGNDASFGSTFTSSAGSSYTATGSDSDKDKVGYSVGGGVDYLAARNVSFGVEYLYTDLGKAGTDTTFTTGAAFGGDPTSFTTSTKTDLDFHTVMAKASYRFN